MRILALAALTTPLAHAASGTWNGTTDGVWATDTNWSAAPAPGTGDTATFNNAGNGNTTIDLGAGVTAGAVLIDTASAAGYTIGTGGQSLTLDNSGTITVASTVTADQVITGIIDGTDLVVTHSGTGSLLLNGANTFTGDIVVDGGGTLTVGNNTFLGATSNTITIGSGATLDLNGVGNGGNNFQAYDASTFILQGGSTLSNPTGTVLNNAFTDQLQFGGDVTITGNHRIDIFGDIDVTGTNITITYDFPDDTLFGSVIGGDMSDESISLWLVKGGALFVNPGADLGDNADLRVEMGGTLRGNGGGAYFTSLDNDIFTEEGSEIEMRNQGGAVFELSGTLTLEGDTDLDPQNQTIAFSSVLAGSGDLDFDFAGKLRLGAGFDDSGYTGTININDVNNNKVIALDDLDVGVVETATLSADLVISEAGANNFDLLVTGAEDTMTVSGDVSGTGAAGITKNGAGALILSGVNTYTGDTKLNGGELSVTGSLSSTISTLASGSTLSVSGILSSAVTIPDGAILSGEGTLDDLTLDAGSTIEIVAAGPEEFTVGTLLAGGAIVAADVTSGTDIVVVNYTTYDDTNFASDFVAPVGGVLTNDTVNSRILLSFPPFRPGAARTWSGADVTNPTFWDVDTSTNWAEGDMVFVPDDIVTFADAAAGAVDVQTQVTPATMTLTNTFGNDYIFDDLAANAQTITAETGGINITGGGDVTMNVKITGNTDITHSGTGTLSLGGDLVDNDFVGTITVDGGGTLRNLRNIDNVNSLGDFGNTFSFSNGSTFDLNSISAHRDYQEYGTGSFVFGDGTTLANSGTTAADSFGDQLVFQGDITLDGDGRFDLHETIAVTGTDIVITLTGDTGNVIGGDNSAQSIAEWVVNNGQLIASNDNALGSAAIVTVNPGGALRANIAGGAAVRTVANDVTLNGGQIETGYQGNSIAHYTGTITVAADSIVVPNDDNGDGDYRELHLTGTLTGSSNVSLGSGRTVFASSLNTAGFTGDFILEKNNPSRALELELKNGVNVTQDIIVADVGSIKNIVVTAGNSAEISGNIAVNDTNPEDFDFDVHDPADTLTVSGNISGGGAAGVTKTSAGSLTLSGQNTYSGNSVIWNGTVTLADGGSQAFYPTANGVTNKVTPSGANVATLNANGEVYFDLSGANITDGNVWPIIEGGPTLLVNVGATFSVGSTLGDFTETAVDSGVWEKVDSGNTWSFDESTGALTVSTGTPYDDWADGTFAKPFTDTDPAVDFDLDGLSNLLEFVLGGDPTISEAGIAPTATDTGGDLVFTFKRSDESKQAPAVDVTVEVTDDLTFTSPGNDIPIGDVGAGPIGDLGASYTVVNAAGFDTVTVTIPKGANTKLFARLQAEDPAP